MGMRCYLIQISKKLINEMKKDHAIVRLIIDSQQTFIEDKLEEEGADITNADEVNSKLDQFRYLDEYQKMYWKEELLEIRSKRAELSKIPGFHEDVLKSLDIGKDWHGIHTILTGKFYGGKKPLCNVILGGKEIGNKDEFGYGCPTYLTPKEVATVSNALNKISLEDFKKRYDPRTASEPKIYHFQLVKIIDDCAYFFEKVKAYYNDAANRKNGMIKYIV
jgi:hypothetical protein